MTLVLYSESKNKFCLYDGVDEYYWRGDDYCVWKKLWYAIEHGWEVIGEL